MQNSQWASMLLAAVLLLVPGSGTLAQTPLNTGFDHATGAPYPTVPTLTSGIPDDYWINIASYPPVVPTPASSWVLQHPGPVWKQSLPGTHWISALTTAGSPGTTGDPAYTLFRKCFCMLPQYTQPRIQFVVRADDTIQVWFNTQLNVLLPPSWGNFNQVALASVPSKPSWFRPGPNCLYVLVEDYGGLMGFDMKGEIQAFGLVPGAAAGASQQFPCPCATGRAKASSLASSTEQGFNDDEVVGELKKMAERRRLERVKKVPPRE